MAQFLCKLTCNWRLLCSVDTDSELVSNGTSCIYNNKQSKFHWEYEIKRKEAIIYYMILPA